jgi:hypothetical protein
LQNILLPTVLRDSLLLVLPPCFYIAKCCCIWLSGPEFQDLDRQTDATSEIIYKIMYEKVAGLGIHLV